MAREIVPEAPGQVGRKPTASTTPPDDVLSRLLALPPHVGDALEDGGTEPALRYVLALTIKAAEASKELESRGREVRAVDREKSAEIVERAIRKRLNKPTGEITRRERASITELDLANTDLTDLSPLAGLTGLQRLDLGHTQVSDVSPLAGLTGLRTLSLWSTQVSDVSPLAGMTGLQSLSLTGTQVSDVSPLAGLTGLRRLGLNETRMTEGGVAELRKALPKCNIQGP